MRAMLQETDEILPGVRHVLDPGWQHRSDGGCYEDEEEQGVHGRRDLHGYEVIAVRLSGSVKKVIKVEQTAGRGWSEQRRYLSDISVTLS